MAKRPTSRAAKPRTPATGRRNAKPTAVKAAKAEAAVARRTKTPASKPTSKSTSGTKAAGSGTSKTVGTRGAIEAKSKKAVTTTGTSPIAKPAGAAVDRAPLSRAAAKPPVGKAPKVEKTKAAAKSGRTGKRVATKAPATIAKPAKPKAGATKAAKPPAPRKTGSRKRRPPSPAYLAAELGQPLDHDGEPVGAGAAIVADDRDLQDYTLHLWRQMQSGRSINKHLQAVERAGLNLDDVWMVGVKETLKTTSTPEEAQLYRKKLLFRANLLEAILSETVSKLVRLDHRADVGGETEAS